MPTGFDLRMVVQSQWEPHAIGLIFLDVQTLDLKDPSEYWVATGKVWHDSKTGRQQVWVQFDKNLTICASRLFWRERPDWTGLPRGWVERFHYQMSFPLASFKTSGGNVRRVLMHLSAPTT